MTRAKIIRAVEIMAVGLLLIGIAIHARAETYHLSQPGQAISKFEAMAAAFKDPGKVVYKCSAVAMTNKATFKNVPNGGGTSFLVEPKAVTK